MKKIRSRGTKPEVKLQKSLWALGYRYRKHLVTLPGKPEIAFTRKKLAVFVDGTFWHGFEWESRKQKIQKNRDYWIPKIERNMARDREQNRQLQEMGWQVMRFWEHEVETDLDRCLEKISRALEKR